jgi:hypothetical protein
VLEAPRHLARALEAPLGRLLEALRDDRHELTIDLGAQLAQVGRRLRGRVLHDLELVGALPWPPAAEELEEHDAEREQIGAAVDLEALGLLGRHVLGLPLQEPRERAREALLRLGEAQVGDLHVALEADEHVARHQIAVHEAQVLAVGRAELVRGREASAHAEREEHHHALAEHLARVEHGLHEPRERHALHELDGEERALRVVAPAHHLDHVGAVQRGREPHLVEELVGEGRIFRDVRVQALHREQATGALRVGGAAEIDPRGGADGDLGKLLERDRARLRRRERRHEPRGLGALGAHDRAAATASARPESRALRWTSR